MRFIMNNEVWEIIKIDKETIVNKYNEEMGEEANFVFGLTIYSKHEIWLNEEMCKDQLIKTLRHELTHCYIWSFGLHHLPLYEEEMVCDIVASSSFVINTVVEDYLALEEEKNEKE